MWSSVPGVWRNGGGVYFVAWLLAVDGGDDVASLQVGLRSRISRQDRHHLQPMSKGIEDETCAVEDLRPIRVFRFFEIDLAAHAVEDLGEFTENTLPNVAREFFRKSVQTNGSERESVESCILRGFLKGTYFAPSAAQNSKFSTDGR
jgi:hypothetical protein